MVDEEMESETLIIILNWNHAEMTIGTIENIVDVENTRKIIVIDNGSKKEEMSKLVEYFTTMKYDIFNENDINNITQINNPSLLLLKENYGYSKGNNFGLRLSSNLGYKYSLIINNDIRLKECLIKYLENFLKHNDTIGVVGPKVINYYTNESQGPYKDTGLYNYFFYPLLFPILFIPDLVCKVIRNRTNRKNENEILLPYTIIGCYLFLRNEDIKKVDYFDENVFLYSEEFILAEKFKNIEKKIAYIPFKQVLHYHGTSTKTLGSKRNIIKENSLLYFLKHYKKYGKIKLLLVKCGNRIYIKIWNKI